MSLSQTNVVTAVRGTGGSEPCWKPLEDLTKAMVDPCTPESGAAIETQLNIPAQRCATLALGFDTKQAGSN